MAGFSHMTNVEDFVSRGWWKLDQHPKKKKLNGYPYGKKTGTFWTGRESTGISITYKHKFF